MIKRQLVCFTSLFFILVLFLNGCTSTKSAAYGLEDEGYIQFMGNLNNELTLFDTSKNYYNDGITVCIDNKQTFKAEVNDIAKKKIKNTKTYAVPSGHHTLQISHNGKEILVKEIFVADQDIRIVELP